ncbi:hypothetical protein BGZ54_007380 [Gamsiella multidivaricata]|nr:hypothetical protein BGZ54_007380 [Gamsiella multidivaricata]
MTRQTARDGDLDFEQMLGELAAMKTDLANRQANRVASRPTRSRTVTADGEPRRVRARRAATDHADVPLSVEAPSTASAISNQTILSPTSPVASRSATLLASLHDSDHDKEQGREPSPSATQGQEQRPKKSDQGQQPEMRIETTLPDTPLHSSEAATKSVQSVQSIEPDDLLGSSSLARSESRRNPAAPLPPKSAQRSRSISNNSGRTSRTFHNEGEINRENDIMPNSQEISPQETSTAIFGSNTPARPSPRTFASAPAITAGNGQQAASSPRLPARSNSRNYVRPSASGTSSTSDQTPQGSRSASRRNTFSKSEGGQEGSLYIGTPSIAEDRELTFVSQSTQDQQQRQQLASTLSEEAPQRIPTKKPSNSTLRRPNEDEGSPNPSIAPSLSPSSTIPSPVFGQHDATLKHEEHERQGRPALRKQQSADPAAMHRQYQQDPPTVRDNLPSRQASERRPDRARNYSNSGNTDDEQLPERGRAQNQDGGSSKGGMFSWVRSRSKSRDATSTRQNQDTPAYPDYNPSLIPSRSASSSGSRTKSLPRKPSNQNLHATNDGWPPYSPGTLNSHPTTPGGSVLNRSLSKSNLIPSKFGTPLSTPNETSQPPPLLNVSTNMNTIHHEKMVRGMGMGSTPIAPTVLLTPQPSFPPTGSNGGAPGGGKRNMALAMMKQDGSPSSSELQMQQRHQQLQQAQMQHIQQQQQRLATTSATNSTSPPATPTSPRNQSTPQGSLAPSTPSSSTSAAATTTPATQRLVATRIYIQTETDFKSVNLAPNSTALDVLHMLQQRGTFGDIGDSRYHDRWTVFEYSKEFMIERPLRDFEVLLDVMKTWEADKDNKMICKSFPARNELSAKEVIRLVGPAGQEDFVRPHGWVHVEMKKGKWVKRYLHTTDTAVYHSKDNKFTGESMLCLLRNFDVYAVQVPRKKAPTKFGFALKSSDSIHMFETPEDDYIHYVCTESGESLRDWLVGLRAIKGIFMYHANPEMIRQGQKRAEELMSSGSQDGLARGKLTDEQVSIVEAKLAGLGMSLSSRSR